VNLTYPVARLLGFLAETEAAALGVPMTIALVDDEGGLVFLARMDGALPASREIAVSKAYTAAALRMATDEVGKLAQPGGTLYGIQHFHPGRVVLFGGGLPLRLNGKVVGAVGISGGTVQEDVRVADCVANALAEMEEWSRLIKTLFPATRLENSWIARLEIRLNQAFNEINHPLSPRALHSLWGHNIGRIRGPMIWLYGRIPGRRQGLVCESLVSEHMVHQARTGRAAIRAGLNKEESL
jgi:uncharacterized protein GlcG (DUF336 family)